MGTLTAFLLPNSSSLLPPCFHLASSFLLLFPVVVEPHFSFFLSFFLFFFLFHLCVSGENAVFPRIRTDPDRGATHPARPLQTQPTFANKVQSAQKFLRASIFCNFLFSNFSNFLFYFQKIDAMCVAGSRIQPRPIRSLETSTRYLRSTI